jgi:type IV secretory pathway protease TraF
MLVQFWVQTTYTLNISGSSTPAGLYQVHSLHLPDLRRGNLVALRMPIKEVLALPGDHVKFTPEGIYREGKLIANTAAEPGIPRCPLGELIVPKYFFVGDGRLDTDSWGSRYVCFIPQSIIAGTVSRIW